MDFGREEFSSNFLRCGHIYSAMYSIHTIRDVCANCLISLRLSDAIINYVDIWIKRRWLEKIDKVSIYLHFHGFFSVKQVHYNH